MEGTEHHFGPFWEKDVGAISGGPFFSRPLWFTAERKRRSADRPREFTRTLSPARAANARNGL